MTEQARSSGRYRESGQNGLEELVISGCMYPGDQDEANLRLWDAMALLKETAGHLCRIRF